MHSVQVSKNNIDKHFQILTERFKWLIFSEFLLFSCLYLAVPRIVTCRWRFFCFCCRSRRRHHHHQLHLFLISSSSTYFLLMYFYLFSFHSLSVYFPVQSSEFRYTLFFHAWFLFCSEKYAIQIWFWLHENCF